MVCKADYYVRTSTTLHAPYTTRILNDDGEKAREAAPVVRKGISRHIFSPSLSFSRLGLCHLQ